MEDLPQEVKDQLKAERLKQYKIRIFNAQMDAAAYRSVGDELRLAEIEKTIQDFITAYKAVEVI